MGYRLLGFCVFLLSVLALCGTALAAPAVNVATAPDARSVAIGTAATIFVEFVNSGDAAATNCSISKPFGVPIDLAYQTLDAGGALTGAPDTPADVGAGASQRFLVTFTPTAAFEGRVHLRYACDNFTPFVFEDVNDLFLTASAGDPPDLIAIFATPSGDGVMRVDSVGGAQAAGGAVVNIGSAGGSATVDVTPTFGDFDTGLGVVLSICETDPATAACMATPTPNVQMTVGAVAKTFSVFAVANAAIGAPLFPEYIRISVIFSDPAAAADTPEGASTSGINAVNGTIRGRGSVAFTSPATTIANPDISVFAGQYILRNRDLINDPNSDFISTGTLSVDANGNAVGLYHRFNVVDGNGAFVGERDQVFKLEGVFDPALLTFTGEMIFIPDLFLNTPPLRGDFVANFDPGRSVRGTYSFKASAGDVPQKTQSTDVARPQTLPASSLNIQVTGAAWDPNCTILDDITGEKTFDLYINGVKKGTATVTRGTGSSLEFSGTVSSGPLTFQISGSFGKRGGFLLEERTVDNVTITAPDGNVVLNDLSGGNNESGIDCTKTSFNAKFVDITRNQSLIVEFRMPMP